MTEPRPRVHLYSCLKTTADDHHGVDSVSQDQITVRVAAGPGHAGPHRKHRDPEQQDGMVDGVTHPLPEYSVIKQFGLLAGNVEAWVRLAGLGRAVHIEQTESERGERGEEEIVHADSPAFEKHLPAVFTFSNGNLWVPFLTCPDQ